MSYESSGKATSRIGHSQLPAKPAAPPGFYQGAMYVSYAINTPLVIAAIIALYLAGASTAMITLATVVISIVTIPITYRLSRMIWLNLFVGYRPQQLPI